MVAIVNGVTDGAAYGYGYGGSCYGYSYGADVGGGGRPWGRKKAEAPAPVVPDDRDWSVKARVEAAPPVPPVAAPVAPSAAPPAVVSTAPYEVVPEVVTDEPRAAWLPPRADGDGMRLNGGSGHRHPQDQPAGDERWFVGRHANPLGLESKVVGNVHSALENPVARALRSTAYSYRYTYIQEPTKDGRSTKRGAPAVGAPS